VASWRAIYLWLWPLSLATAIFIASGRSEVMGPDIIGIDKVAHFAVFGLLATLVLRTGCRPWVAVLLVSLFGFTDEWHQSFTPGRMVEVADWVADTLGAITAVAIYARWTRYRVWLEMPLVRPQPRVENRATVVPTQAK